MSTTEGEIDRRRRSIPAELPVMVVLSIFLIAPLLTPHWIQMGESIDQVIRVIETARGLKEGIPYPRWLGDMAGGFGYPYFVFYSPLIYLVSGLLHLMGFGVIASLKGMIIFGVMLAGVGMFYFARLFFGPLGATVSAVAYVYLPYRIVNLYVRGDLAEAFAMSVLPWVFYFLYQTMSSHRRRLPLALLSLSFGALVVSHNCTALTGSALIGLFLLFVSWSETKLPGLARGLLGLLLGAALTALFWLPALLEKEWVNIELIYSNAAFDFRNNFLEPFRLFSPLWSLAAGIGGRQLPLQIGTVHVVLAIVTSVLFFRSGKAAPQSARNLVHFFVLSGLLVLFFMLSPSVFFWEHLPLLSYVQFPWRLLALLGFCLSLLAGGGFVFLRGVSNAGQTMLQATLVVVIISISTQYCYVRGYYILDEQELTPAFVRKQWSTASSYNTKEMARIQDYGEYLPKTVKRLPDRGKAGQILVTSGKAEVTQLQNRLDGYRFEAFVEEAAELTVGSFYYPSWVAEAGGKSIALFTDEEGLIHLRLPEGKHRLEVFFGPSRPRTAAGYISLCALVFWLGLVMTAVVQSVRPKILKPKMQDRS